MRSPLFHLAAKLSGYTPPPVRPGRTRSARRAKTSPLSFIQYKMIALVRRFGPLAAPSNANRHMTAVAGPPAAPVAVPVIASRYTRLRMRKDLISWVARALGILLFMMVQNFSFARETQMPDFYLTYQPSGKFIIFLNLCCLVFNLALWWPVRPIWTSGLRVATCVLSFVIFWVWSICFPITGCYTALLFLIFAVIFWVSLQDLFPNRRWEAVLMFPALLWAYSSFLKPGLDVVHQLQDPSLYGAKIPYLAWQLHDELVKTYPHERPTEYGEGRGLTDIDIIYLQSVEALESAWHADRSLASIEPAVQDRLIVEDDAWLARQPFLGIASQPPYPAFSFRSVVTLTDYTLLTQNKNNLYFLRAEVEALAKEISDSPSSPLVNADGVGYPCDELAALAAIHRADAILQTDHSALFQRARGSFTRASMDPNGFPYVRDRRNAGFNESATTDLAAQACVDAQEIWPDLADQWYQRLENTFWREEYGFVGFKETDYGSRGIDFLRFGLPASEMGLAAARVQGRFDQADPLVAELVFLKPDLSVDAAPIPGTIGATDAKIRLLYALTRQPVGPTPPAKPIFTLAVYLGLFIYFGGALLFSLPLLSFIARGSKKMVPAFTKLRRFTLP